MRRTDETIATVILNLLDYHINELDDQTSININKWLVLKINELINSKEYENIRSSLVSTKLLKRIVKDLFGCTINNISDNTRKLISSMIQCGIFDPNLNVFISMFGPISQDEAEDHIWTYYRSLT